jgi:hypothetical protein
MRLHRKFCSCWGKKDIFNYFPSINGYFSDERRSPRISALDVQAYASGENPCAALLIKKYLIYELETTQCSNVFMDGR